MDRLARQRGQWLKDNQLLDETLAFADQVFGHMPPLDVLGDGHARGDLLQRLIDSNDGDLRALLEEADALTHVLVDDLDASLADLMDFTGLNAPPRRSVLRTRIALDSADRAESNARYLAESNARIEAARVSSKALLEEAERKKAESNARLESARASSRALLEEFDRKHGRRGRQ